MDYTCFEISLSSSSVQYLDFGMQYVSISVHCVECKAVFTNTIL